MLDVRLHFAAKVFSRGKHVGSRCGLLLSVVMVRVASVFAHWRVPPRLGGRLSCAGGSYCQLYGIRFDADTSRTRSKADFDIDLTYCKLRSIFAKIAAIDGDQISHADSLRTMPSCSGNNCLPHWPPRAETTRAHLESRNARHKHERTSTNHGQFHSQTTRCAPMKPALRHRPSNTGRFGKLHPPAAQRCYAGAVRVIGQPRHGR